MKEAGVSSIVVAAVMLTIAMVANAQQPTKVPRIGFLDPSTASGSAVLWDVVPKLARVGFLRLPSGSNSQLKEIRPAAVALKLKLEEIETQADAKGLESAFQTAKQKQVGAIMTTTSRIFFAERKRIVELAGKYQLPAIYPQKEYIDEGGLMSYGEDSTDQFRRTA